MIYLSIRCRKDHADKLLLNNDKNTLLVHVSSNSYLIIFD